MTTSFGDFHLISGAGVINKGLSVPAITGQTIATDPDGNTRGADGAWDIGAYEYQGGTTVSNPTTYTITPTVGANGTVSP